MFWLKKKKAENLDLILADREDYIAILSKIVLYLQHWAYYGQAEVVEKLIELLTQENLEQFSKLLNSIDMWGGSGAVWEVYIDDPEGAKLFQKEMIRLIDLMEKTKALGRGIKQIREFFESQLH